MKSIPFPLMAPIYTSYPPENKFIVHYVLQHLIDILSVAESGRLPYPHVRKVVFAFKFQKFLSFDIVFSS